MSPQQAITDCQRAREVTGARWPAPLVAYLDNPPSDRRVFDWLCSCVSDLLSHLGESTAEVEAALALACRSAGGDADREAIEELAWCFWSRRSLENTTFTAIAQLFFALVRSDRSRTGFFAAACSTPICLLESLESRRGEVFDRVVTHFAAHAGNRPA